MSVGEFLYRVSVCLSLIVGRVCVCHSTVLDCAVAPSHSGIKVVGRIFAVIHANSSAHQIAVPRMCSLPSVCTTLGTHAQQGLRYLVRFCLSVCLLPQFCLSVRPAVCYRIFCHHAQGDNKRVIPIGSALHWLDVKFGDVRKSTAFKSYGVKPSQKAIMQMNTGLPRPHPIALCILKAQEVATKGVYRNAPRAHLPVPCMHSWPRVCTLVLFIFYLLVSSHFYILICLS